MAIDGWLAYVGWFSAGVIFCVSWQGVRLVPECDEGGDEGGDDSGCGCDVATTSLHGTDDDEGLPELTTC